MSQLTYIDLFAGAGGLSEGFERAGFKAIAHVEMNKEATDTLRTRTAYHYFKQKKDLEPYYKYLQAQTKAERNNLWNWLPQHSLNSVIHSEISDITIKDIFQKIDLLVGKQKVNVIIGGPPCQAYSLIGRSRDPNRMRNDNRNYLFKYYAEFLRRYQPEYFVFENVLGLLTAGNSMYFKEMRELFRELGYATDYNIFESEKFGVLQKRRRVILIGKKGKSEFKIPDFEPFVHNNYQVKKDLFSDLPYLRPGDIMNLAPYTNACNEYLQQTNTRNGIDFTTQHICRPHNSRDLEIYSIAIEKWLDKSIRLHYDEVPERLRTHQNLKSFVDRYKVVNDKGFSHTMVAHISKDGHHFIYPDKAQVRSISVREAARIQSFPDDYFFEGGRSAAYKQIGNAVPPLMAGKIAEKILNLLYNPNSTTPFNQ